MEEGDRCVVSCVDSRRLADGSGLEVLHLIVPDQKLDGIAVHEVDFVWDCGLIRDQLCSCADNERNSTVPL